MIAYFAGGSWLVVMILACLSPQLWGGAAWFMIDREVRNTGQEAPIGKESTRVREFAGFWELHPRGGFGKFRPGVAVVPGGREVAVFPYGEDASNGPTLLVGAGRVKGDGESTISGVVFQPMNLPEWITGTVERGGQTSEGFFLRHSGRFLLGDWGRVFNDTGKISRGVVCVLLDKEGRPTECWSMDSLRGPERIELPSLPPEFQSLRYFLEFPIGGLCGWANSEDGQANLAIVLGRIANKRTQHALFMLANGRWTREPLYAGTNERFRSHGVIPADIRLAWSGRTFEALLAMAEPRTQAELLRVSWETGLERISVPTNSKENQNLRSFHLVPSSVPSRNVGRQDSVTAIYSKRDGYPNFPIREGASGGAEFWDVKLGENPEIRLHTVRGDSTVSKQQRELRFQGVLTLNFGSKGEGVFCAQSLFSNYFGILNVQEDGKWRISSGVHSPANEQFLGAYSVVLRTDAVLIAMAPNLFHGELNLGPSLDPVSIVRFDRETLNLTIETIPANRLVAPNLNVVVVNK